MKVIRLIVVLCSLCAQYTYPMDVAAIDNMRRDERKNMEHTVAKKNYSRREALNILNRYAVGQASFSDAVAVLDQLSEDPEQLCSVELPWWKTQSSDTRKLLMLYYHEHMGFRYVGTRPNFEEAIERRKDAAQCRQEFEEVARYLLYDVHSECYDKNEEAKAHLHVNQNDIKEIYGSLCRELSEFEVRPSPVEGGDYHRAVENRIIAARHVIYLWGTDGSKDVEFTMEVVNEALATLLRTKKLNDELLEIGWVRADMPNVRVAYLLAYYLLYGDKADSKYKQLKNYVDHFIHSEERMGEIQQVQAFIDNRIHSHREKISGNAASPLAMQIPDALRCSRVSLSLPHELTRHASFPLRILSKG